MIKNMNKIDLNCDMGEGFGQWKIGEDIDEELMKIISSSNIATGFHAGDQSLRSAKLETHSHLPLRW